MNSHLTEIHLPLLLGWKRNRINFTREKPPLLQRQIAHRACREQELRAHPLHITPCRTTATAHRSVSKPPPADGPPGHPGTPRSQHSTVLPYIPAVLPFHLWLHPSRSRCWAGFGHGDGLRAEQCMERSHPLCQWDGLSHAPLFPFSSSWVWGSNLICSLPLLGPMWGCELLHRALQNSIHGPSEDCGALPLRTEPSAVHLCDGSGKGCANGSQCWSPLGLRSSSLRVLSPTAAATKGCCLSLHTSKKMKADPLKSPDENKRSSVWKAARAEDLRDSQVRNHHEKRAMEKETTFRRCRRGPAWLLSHRMGWVGLGWEDPKGHPVPTQWSFQPFAIGRDISSLTRLLTAPCSPQWGGTHKEIRPPREGGRKSTHWQ